MDRIPQEARAVFESLMALPLMPEAELGSRVDTYLEILRDLRDQRNRDIDMTLAETLADRSHRLLDSITAMTGEDDRRLIQTAVRYFLDAADAAEDMHSGGLDDDVAVMNAVTASLLRTDLLIRG